MPEYKQELQAYGAHGVQVRESWFSPCSIQPEHGRDMLKDSCSHAEVSPHLGVVSKAWAWLDQLVGPCLESVETWILLFQFTLDPIHPVLWP